jgi:hypothetical protein
MSWLTSTLFGTQDRVKSTLAYGSLVFSLVALILTVLMVIVLRH